jgi:hypothetical protein
VDISTHRLLFEGARIFPDAVRLEAALGKLDRSSRVATRPPFDFMQLNLSPAERAVLQEAADELLISETLDREGWATTPPMMRAMRHRLEERNREVAAPATRGRVAPHATQDRLAVGLSMLRPWHHTAPPRTRATWQPSRSCPLRPLPECWSYGSR